MLDLRLRVIQSKEAIKRIAVDLTNIWLELNIDPKSLELLETEKQCIEDRRADLVARVQDSETRAFVAVKAGRIWMTGSSLNVVPSET